MLAFAWPLSGDSFFVQPQGDVYAIETRKGTYILVRTETGGATAVAYIELPPAVAQAWMGAMNERKSWLWPTEEKTVGDEKEYVLGKNGEPEDSISSITYAPSPSGYVAERSGVPYYASAHKEVNTRELIQAAKNAKS